MWKALWLLGLLLLWAGPLEGQREPEEVRALLADSVEAWAARADSLAFRNGSTAEWQRLAGRVIEQLRQHQLAIDQMAKLIKNECDYWLFHAGCPTVVVGPGIGALPDEEVQVRIVQLTVGIPLNIPWLSGPRKVQMDSIRAAPP